MPHTGAFIGESLGLHCGSFDVSAACAGFVYELVIGAAMVQMGYEHVLIVGAETLSRIVDPEDRTTTVLFGDGAGAAVLAPTRETPGMLAWDLGCDGSAAGLLEVPAGGSRMPTSAATVADREHYMKMSGQEVFRRAVRAVVDSATATLERGRRRRRPTSTWFVPHQANARIIDAAANRLGFAPERTLVNIEQLRQHLVGVDPARVVRSGRRRSRSRRRPRAVLRLRRGHDLGERAGALGRAMSAAPADRVAFVTGGSRGIGRATVARARARRSPRRLLLLVRRRRRAARRAKPSSTRAARRSRCAPTSPTPTRSTRRSARSRAAFGPVTILVNNAGITRDGLVVRMSDEQWGAVRRHESHRRVPHDPPGHARA